MYGKYVCENVCVVNYCPQCVTGSDAIWNAEGGLGVSDVSRHIICWTVVDTVS